MKTLYERANEIIDSLQDAINDPDGTSTFDKRVRLRRELIELRGLIERLPDDVRHIVVDP